MILKSRYAMGYSALLLLLISLVSGRSGATSVAFSESMIQPSSGSTLENFGTTASSLDDGPNNFAGSSIFPSSGTMRARVFSDGSVSSVHTRTTNSDDWTCVSGCAVAPTLGLRVAIGFDATVTGTPHEFTLLAQYTIGGDTFLLSVGADSSAIDGSA